MKKILFSACMITLAASQAFAGVTFLGNSPQGPVYRAEVSFSNFELISDPQEQSQWCWAASVSNVFRYHGYNLSQSSIVKSVYGREVNLPSFSARKIAELLNREWVDDDGRHFRSTLTAAYDALAGVNAIDNNFIINNLKNERPLIVCNTHHCMVLTAIDYTPISVIGAGVFDPWPLTPKAHPLSPAELVAAHLGGELTFVAAIRVEKLSEKSGREDDPQEEKSSDEIVGAWSGTLHTPNGSLTLVLHIKENDGRLKATCDSPDQNAFGIKVTSISLSSKTLKYSIATLGVTFRGQLNDDEISGTFRQNGMSLPITFSRD